MTHDPFLAMKWEEIEGSDTVFKTIKKEENGTILSDHFGLFAKLEI